MLNTYKVVMYMQNLHRFYNIQILMMAQDW